MTYSEDRDNQLFTLTLALTLALTLTLTLEKTFPKLWNYIQMLMATGPTFLELKTPGSSECHVAKSHYRRKKV